MEFCVFMMIRSENRQMLDQKCACLLASVHECLRSDSLSVLILTKHEDCIEVES